MHTLLGGKTLTCRHLSLLLMTAGPCCLVIDDHTRIGRVDEGKKMPPLLIVVYPTERRQTKPRWEMTTDIDFAIENG